MKSHLKVKVFALTNEMTYIRRQEEKWKTKARYARKKQEDHAKQTARVQYAEGNFWTQRWHRLELKVEARITHLAYGCIYKVPYAKMENICYGGLKGYDSTEPDWQKIESMVERFTKDEPHPQTYMQAFGEWLADAKKWYELNPDRISAALADRKAEYERKRSDPNYQKLKTDYQNEMKQRYQKR